MEENKESQMTQIAYHQWLFEEKKWNAINQAISDTIQKFTTNEEAEEIKK